MKFKQAKTEIRRALREDCDDAKLVELLEAARNNHIPFASLKTCLAMRVHGNCRAAGLRPRGYSTSLAYGMIDGGDKKRQRILVPMILAEMRRRVLERGEQWKSL